MKRKTFTNLSHAELLTCDGSTAYYGCRCSGNRFSRVILNTAAAHTKRHLHT